MWRSRPLVLGQYPAGNTLLSFAILMAGASVSKILLVLKHMGISIYSAHTYFAHQSKFLFPAILTSWKQYNTSPSCLKRLRNREGPFGAEMGDSTLWDTLQNMEPTRCSVVQLLKLHILSWFRYVVTQNMDKKKIRLLPL